ncbi:MAG: sortase [Oscillospiraceae bacterium]|nr:sortase [Oscillospiraceae bacterium]
MRNKLGNGFMILGAALMIAALSLFLHNQNEAAAAEKASVALLPQLVEEIESQLSEGTEVPQEVPGTPVELLDPSVFEMTEVEIDGYGYIGYLSIPDLELELPVMADWDYGRLKIAPCRYVGSTKGEDLVIMAHNYTHHFGRLSELSEGASVIFVDMDGNTTNYEVVALDILAPTDVEEMTSGDYDLTLFTCTYGGKSRVTVGCDLVKN